MRRGHGGEEEKTGCESEAAGPGLSPGVFCEEATERRRQRKSEKERREEGSTHGLSRVKWVDRETTEKN